MSEPPWLDPEEDPTVPEPMLDWEAPRDPLASAVPKVFKKPITSTSTYRDPTAKRFSTFLVYMAGGFALVALTLTIWIAAFLKPGFLIQAGVRRDAALPTLAALFVVVITFGTLQAKSSGCLAGIFSGIVAADLIFIGLILLILHQCAHSHW